MDNDSLLYFLAFLPTIGYFMKMGMNAWSGSKQGGGDSAVSSIVQYSLMTLYLAAVVAIIGSKIHKGVMRITNDFMWFFGSIVFIFIVYVAIIVMHAVHYPKLQYGRITPGISESVNNLIMIPLWILIFYNMHTFLECQKNLCHTCIRSNAVLPGHPELQGSEMVAHRRHAYVYGCSRIGLAYDVRINITKMPRVSKKLIITNTTERYMYG
jgi:hypothetical protein